jgi:hypothetical protein
LKTHQQRDNERDAKIKELEENIYKFEHGSKFEVLAQLVMVEIGNKEPIRHARTLTRPTFMSLGVELSKGTKELSQIKDWEKENSKLISKHTKALEQ